MQYVQDEDRGRDRHEDGQGLHQLNAERLAVRRRARQFCRLPLIRFPRLVALTRGRSTDAALHGTS